jgi:hypothetical protein
MSSPPFPFHLPKLICCWKFRVLAARKEKYACFVKTNVVLAVTGVLLQRCLPPTTSPLRGMAAMHTEPGLRIGSVLTLSALRAATKAARAATEATTMRRNMDDGDGGGDAGGDDKARRRGRRRRRRRPGQANQTRQARIDDDAKIAAAAKTATTTTGGMWARNPVHLHRLRAGNGCQLHLLWLVVGCAIQNVTLNKLEKHLSWGAMAATLSILRYCDNFMNWAWMSTSTYK